MISTMRNAQEAKPYITYGIILLCVFVFALPQNFGNNDDFKHAYSLVPYEITTGTDLIEPYFFNDASTGAPLEVAHKPAPFSVYFNFISSMFMHVNFFHLLSNLLFLGVFGTLVERRVKHVRYALLFLISGVAGGAFQIIADPLLRISILGASGAISGILGGYLVLYPKEKIEIEVFARAIKIPIAFAAWAWAISQVVSAFALQPDLNGTAYIAHVGGFASGIVLAKILSKSAPPKQKRKFG